MGLYDDPAFIDTVRRETGQDKIFYIGYSQGTMQMFYGLSHKQDYFADALHKAVLLAPCFIAADCPEYDQLMETYARLPDLGIYAMKGPNYKEDRKVICDNMPFI